VLRLDLRGYLGIGRSVLGVKHTEARARGRTEPYQLGGALDPQLQLGTALNSRRIALRGYDTDELSLLGTDARVSSIEWRTPIADVDRHDMVPPIGLNRISATLFFDIGGAWTLGDRPAQYKRGAGVELIGELKLLYSLGLQVRGGLAKGLDEPRDVLGYLSLGRAF
jgi:outer membrane protein assembly factor BamA